jgi:hypothetical protein
MSMSRFHLKKRHVKRLAAIFLLPMFVMSSRAQENLTPTKLTNGPICTMCSASRYYREEGRVKTGLSVDMLVGPAQINEPITLRFFVNQKPASWPEDHLEMEHEKFMHVIGVRDDLQEFFHIHPVKTAPGMWTVTHVFTNGGNYKIWTDVRCLGISYAVGHPLLTVSGSMEKVGRNHDFRDTVESSGYRVTLKHSEPLLMGRTNQLEFTIRDDSGKDVAVENFLGAAMHLVAVRDDLSVYLHGHPELPQENDPKIHFRMAFSNQGTYKLFAQFRPAKTKLPADEAIVAEFYVNVTMRQAPAALAEKRSQQPNPRSSVGGGGH